MKIEKYTKVTFSCGHFKVFGAWEQPERYCSFCHAPAVAVEIIENLGYVTLELIEERN